MNDRDLLVRAENKIAQAHLSKDWDLMDALLHEDYLILQSGGKMESKKEVLDSYKSGNRHWDKVEMDIENIVIEGNFARVIGQWKASGKNHSSPFDYKARFISIWVKNKEWKNIFYSFSEIQ